MIKFEQPAAKNATSSRTQAGSTQYHSPFIKMEQMTDDCMDRTGFFPDRFLRPSWPERIGLFGEATKPRVDVFENDDKIVVTAEAPGFNKDKKTLACLGRIQYLFDVTINDDTLTVEGKAGYKGQDESDGNYCRKIHSDDFTRTLTLPASVNCDEAKACFRNGVFELTLPKTNKAKRRNLQIVDL